MLTWLNRSMQPSVSVVVRRFSFSGNARMRAALSSSSTRTGMRGRCPTYSVRGTLGRMSRCSTGMTWVMNSGISSVFDRTNMTCRSVSRISVWSSPASCSRVCASSPMKGLSIIRSLGPESNVLVSWNFRNSPLDKVMIYLSNRVERWNIS